MISCRPVYCKATTIVLALLLLSSCSDSRKPVPEEEEAAGSQPVQQLFETRIRLFDLNGLSGLLLSPRIDQYQTPDEIKMPMGFQLFTYDSLGRDEATMVADTGYYQQRHQKLRAMGNVRIISEKGLTLYTNSLHWDQRRRRVYTQDSVKFVTETDTLYGIGFEASRDLSWWEIKQTRGRSWRRVEEE